MQHLLRLRSVVKPYLFQIALNTLILLAMTGLSLYIPSVLRNVIDKGLALRQPEFLLHSALVLLGLGLLTAGMSGVWRYLSEWIGAQIGYDLRNRLYDRIQHLSFSYHDHAQTGQLISRCIE
ncbi:MAG: ABC transporter ATP-binding protein, partial [Anaerolinea sp.]|nr:ABC transporter ATP-binding protein [Anaerolinea sp.]